jgi:hypothetical protein
MLALQSALFFYYVLRGVDALTDHNHYVGYFFLTVPLLALTLTVTQVVLVVMAALASRPAAVHLRTVRRSVLAAGVLATVALLVTGLTAGQLRGPPALHQGYPQAVATLEAAPGRNGGRIALEIVPGSLWPQAAGIAIQAERTGLPWCVLPTNPHWSNLWTPTYMCTETAQHYYVVGVVPANQSSSARAPILFRAKSFALTGPNRPATQS